MSGVLSQISYAETYTGDDSTLKTSAQVSTQFEQLLNIPNAKGFWGNFGFDSNGNRILTIDYENTTGTKPEFIVLGYGNINKESALIDNKIINLNNKVFIKKGNVDGDIYVGLSHYIEKNNDINCPLNQNDGNFCLSYSTSAINIQKEFSDSILINNYNSFNIEEIKNSYAYEDINVGKSIIEFEYNNFIASSYNKKVDIYFIQGLSYVFNSMNLYGNKLELSNNSIIINGNNEFNDINLGHADIKLKYNNSNAEKSNVFEENLTTRIRSDAFTYMNNTLDSNILTSSYNDLYISGNNKFNDINVGKSNITVNIGNLNSADAFAESKKSNTELQVTSGSHNYSYVNFNQQTSSSNSVNITGSNKFNNINIGQANLYLDNGDMNAATSTADSYNLPDFDSSAFLKISIDSNKNESSTNSIDIVGDNEFKDIKVGQAGIELRYKDINAGLKVFNNIKTADEAYLNLDLRSYDFPDQNSGNLIPAPQILSANNNTINIKGNSYINGDVVTGYLSLYVDYGKLTEWKIDNNEIIGKVTVDDPLLYINGVFRDEYKKNYIDLNGSKAFANNNIISIEGNHTFSNAESVLYGGYLNYNKDKEYFLADTQGNKIDVKTFIRPESYDVFTGNVLNYNNSVPIKIKEIGNFQTYNFILISDLINSNKTLIIANSIFLGSSEDNMSQDQLQLQLDQAGTGSQISSDIKIVGIASGDAIAKGTKHILMQAGKGKLYGEGYGESTSITSTTRQGISLDYVIDTVVDKNNDQVYVLFNTGAEPTEPGKNPGVNPQLKALLDGNLSGLMLVTRGADQLNGLTAQEQRGLVPFVISSGQHSRYNSGSHIKSNGALLTTGISVYDENVVWGAFVENGWDSYKTHNQFNNEQSVRGKGHNSFNGFGTFARYTFDNQLYLDGTLRIGRLKTSFETNDIVNVTTKEQARYNISGNYYGASLKGGYNWTWNNKNTVDLSVKYAWAGTESQNLTVAGDPMHFDALNSHRVLLSAENHYQFTPELKLTSGLGYEYEFDGRAKGTTYHAFGIDEASVKGSTGVVAAGLNYQPSQIKGLNINLKGNGYFGKREGGGALLEVNYEF